MTTYICKCGRQVKKATNADNTGNRDTEGCKGCPYLLPWGPDKYIEGQGFTKDVQGYECRMSPTISYTTTYRGQANDKCTLHILSLDLDFLDEVQAWIYDNAADILSAGFSRGSMRGTDFSDKGRYSLSVSCTQNKKGMAAKAALLDRFFTGGRVRKDMTLVQEKAHILAAIKKGKEQAQGKDNTMKRQNDRCPLQQECERTCQMIGHERDCDYYVNNRYCTEGILDQDELLAEEELRQEREREERYLASLSAEPAEPVVYQNEYGTLFAVREHKSAPALMCKAKGADRWTLSGVLAAVKGEAYTTADLQEVLDEYARAHGWQKSASDEDRPPENPTDAGADVPPCVPTASDAQTSPCQNADAGAKTGAEKASENPTAAAPASRADAGAAEQNLSAAGPASLVAEDMNVPAFDYSGLDDQTVSVLHLAESEIREARQVYICRVSAAVAAAHDAVVANCENGESGKFSSHEKTFLSWCASVGLKKDAAYRLLQVNHLLTSSTPEEQGTLEAASPSLLYAAAKPSAPAELVQAVKDGDITTHKQYQEALAEIRARDAKIEDLLEMSEAADRRAEEAERKRRDAERALEQERTSNAGTSALLADEQQRRQEANEARIAAESRASNAVSRARAAEEENSDLRRQLQEIEERPRDVAVMQPSEEQIESWRREGEKRMADTVKDQVSQANKDKINAQRQVADLQKQLEKSRPDADTCQRIVDTLYETVDGLRQLLRMNLMAASMSPTVYAEVVRHVLEAAGSLRTMVRECAPAGTRFDEEDDDFE